MAVINALPSSVLTWKGALFFALVLKLQYLFRSIRDPWAQKERGPQFLNKAQKLLLCNVESFAKYWHRYEVHGLQQLRRLPGSILLVGYHSRSSFDLLYLFSVVKPKMLVSYLFFKVPIVRDFLTSLGVISSRLDNKSNTASFLDAITNGDRPLLVLPGGQFEAFKQYEQRYQLHWKDVPGFARVMAENREAVRHVRVVPFFTARCEEVLLHTRFSYNLSGRIVEKMYASFKAGNILVLPFMLTAMVLSFGFLLLPNRIKLDTYFGEPLELREDETPEHFAARVKEGLEQLMNRVNAESRRNHVHRYVKPYGLFDRLNGYVYGAYTFLQNLALCVLMHVLFCLCMFPTMLIVWLKIKIMGKPARNKKNHN